MLVQGELVIFIEFPQPVHLLVKPIKRSGDMLIIGEKMPHSICQFSVNRKGIYKNFRKN